MLTGKEALRLIENGESQRVEFKISFPKKIHDLLEEVCAFANKDGGIIFIGVNDDSEIVGTDLSNSERSVFYDCLQRMSPYLPVNLYPVDVEGTTVWVIDIPKGIQKPYFFSGKLFVREGTNSQKINDVNEIRKIFQENNTIEWEELEYPNFDLVKELDESVFDTFLKNTSLNIFDKNKLLINLHAMNENGIALGAGILFFSKHPENVFPQAIIQCTSFKGTNRLEIIDNKIFGGSLFYQYIETAKWLEKNLSVSYEFNGFEQRKEHWELPLEALKEALLNAICHRDYSVREMRITVSLFSDRLEITNPGVPPYSVQNRFGFLSWARNRQLFTYFERLHLVEQVGSGIVRMRNTMVDNGLNEPEFILDDFFSVVFYKKTICLQFYRR